jgi:CRISPR-associated exonuclease Cas4
MEQARTTKGDLADPIPLSALQHAVYCLRQAALIHLERLWEENRFTAEGRVLHDVADKPSQRTGRGVRRVTTLPLASSCYNIAGVADVVEFHPHGEHEIPYPVEYKRGKPKTHRADEVQLCAQALCLEEMTGQSVPEGALFYAETKRRTIVVFDDSLRHLTIETILQLQQIFQTLKTPVAVYHAEKCRGCSLLEVCQPKVSSRQAKIWRNRMVESLAATTEFSS